MDFGLSKEEYKLFVQDAKENCIVVGGNCSNNCIFCSCKVQEKMGRRNSISFISKEDLLGIIGIIDDKKIVYFGEGKNFLSCEPFQHPNFIELIKLFNSYYSNTKKITTTVGKFINAEHYNTLKSLNINFVVSINTFDRNKRAELMKSKDDFFGLINFLKECYDIVVKTSFIYTGDLDILKKDIEKLFKINKNYQNTVSLLRLPDYSSYHKKEAVELYKKAKETWYDAVRIFNKAFNHPGYWLRSLTDFPDDIENKNTIDNHCYNIFEARKEFEMKIHNVTEISDSNLWNLKEVCFLLPESTYDYFKIKFPDLNGLLVKNNYFGGSYIVGGLMTKNDVLNAIFKEKKYSIYVAPKLAFGSNALIDISGASALADYPINMMLF